LRFARFASSRTLLQSPAGAEAEVEAVAFTAGAVGFTAGAVGLLRFTVGAAGVVAGMAVAVGLPVFALEAAGFMGLLPVVAWLTWVTGGVVMH
jgi:hypothetical protein